MAFNNTNTDILLAGAFAALSIDILVYPLDTIKTRFQSPDYKRLYTSHATGTANRALFRGLYQGIGSVVLATIPSSGAFFTTYEGTKAVLYNFNSSLSSSSSATKGPLPIPVINSLASCTGELVSCLILTPAEVLKQNAQVLQKSASSAVFDLQATRHALRKFNRPSQLWRGYTALAARNLPFTAMQFPMYEYLKEAILERRRKRGRYTGTLPERALATAAAASAAGSVAALITTPVDVVKTRIMLAASKTGSDNSKTTTNKAQSHSHGKSTTDAAALRQAAREGRSGSSWAVGREILASEGARGLFRGATLRAGWTALGSGLYLAFYETARTYLESRRVPST